MSWTCVSFFSIFKNMIRKLSKIIRRTIFCIFLSCVVVALTQFDRSCDAYQTELSYVIVDRMTDEYIKRERVKYVSHVDAKKREKVNIYVIIFFFESLVNEILILACYLSKRPVRARETSTFFECHRCALQFACWIFDDFLLSEQAHM
jgi:hypothetical protein